MEQSSNCLFITFVENEGPFLKVWGQTDKNTSLYIEQVLHTFTAQYDEGLYIPPLETIQVGDLCCAKYKDNKYYRARVTSFYLQNKYIEVNFVDYGNQDIVPVTNLRTLDILDKALQPIPPQAHCFLLAEAVCLGGEWDTVVLEEICKEIRYSEVNFSIVAQVTKHFLVRLYVSTNDLTILLITRGLMRHTSLTTQEAVLLAMMSRVPPPQPPVQQNLATYKAYTLEPGRQYEVYVSYVTDGPSNFSVQLKQTEETLSKLMKEINSMNLTPLDGVPVPGTVCLARCVEDEHICRAVVTNEVDGQYKVFYVDFGNFEVVPIDVLYEIPFKYVIPKVMAIRFALAGVDKTSITFDMLCAFKQFVDDRLIHMKVLPMPTRTGLPHCELWDPHTQISALDILNQAASASFPEHISLNRGFCQPVKVSYVFSCNRFFVQLKSKQDDLLRLMLELQNACKDTQPLTLDKIKPGMPCCTMFALDEKWYRSQILSVSDGQVQVHYVDYGNEDLVFPAFIRPIDGKQLTILRPQAIECCLNGYQNMGIDAERDNLLEELILEKEFTMKVIEMNGKKALIELIDSNNYNVASLLLDKIAVNRSQVSPMLVQAGNIIEHRKPREQQPSFRNTRPQKQWGKQENFWRQENKGYRNNKSTESDESFELNSSKQQNRGFTRNERNSRRESDLNHSNDNEKFNRSSNRGNDSHSDSWRQNNKDLNSSKSRPNREMNNRSNEWGGGGGGDHFERKNFSPREKNNDWNSPREGGDNKNWNNAQENEWNREKTLNNSRGSQDGSKNFRDRDSSFKKNRFTGEKTDFKRAPSEVSSNGSEKGSKKNYRDRDNSRQNNNNKRNDNFKKPQVKQETVPDPASSSDTFKSLDLSRPEFQVTISWFHNPSHFYCLIDENQSDFKAMMTEIQEAYKSRSPSPSLQKGSPVIGLFPEDNVLYRAQILDSIGAQFKVYYVDFGNVALIDKVWPIEKRFMALPAQALCCKLGEIQPVNETWLEQSTNFGSYFSRPSFTCKVIGAEDERTVIKLENNGEDIGSLLVKDGLAVAQLPPKVPEIEPQLFVGQQFRAMLLTCGSLAKFAMSLQNGALLNCGVFNLAESSESFQEELERNLNKILIVYVDNVLEDNTLEVTLYYGDSGKKIKLVDQDEQAFENVELICPYLVSQSKLSGVISHAENSTIFLQPEDCTENIEYLLNAIFEFYENSTLEAPIVPVEGYVYAVKGSDSNWYRARVVEISTETTIKVNYIDYGNGESVEIGNLRELTLGFMEMSALCVPIVVSTAVEGLIGSSATLSVKFTETALEGTIEGVEQVCSEPVEEAAAVEIPALEEPAVIDPPSSSSLTKVVVSHIDSPSDFYLQLLEAVTSVEQLQATLQENIAEFNNMENPVAVGVLCAAPYTVDRQWYRAQVLDSDSDITTVRFVDYGNTDVLDNCITRVKTLPPELLATEMYATRCRLQIKPIEEEWSSAASARFEQLCSHEEISVEFISQDEKINYVKLFSGDVNISEVMISENLAQEDVKAAKSENSGTNGFMSHLNSPSEFWIQLENCIDELEWIAEQLSGAEAFKELEELAPGTLCAALFPDDCMWYRARILSNTVAGIEVVFVDYGNSCTSCSLRELPEELVMMAPLAQKCSLQKPETLQNWGPEMLKKFNEVSADGQTTFVVKKIKTGETALVDLFVNDVNVISMILPQTEEVTITSWESFDEIKLVRQGEEKVCKLEPLQDTVWNEESLKKFSEIVNEVQGVFQAEFVDEEVVRLYNGLNDVRLNLNGVKTPVATPAKIQRESVELSNDMHEIVNEMIQVGLDENAKVIVEHIVTDLVNGSFKENEEEVVKKEESALEVVEDAINDIVAKVTLNNSTECDKIVEKAGESVLEETETAP